MGAGRGREAPGECGVVSSVSVAGRMQRWGTAFVEGQCRVNKQGSAGSGVHMLRLPLGRSELPRGAPHMPLVTPAGTDTGTCLTASATACGTDAGAV